MIEISKKQIAGANLMLWQSALSGCQGGHISMADRLSGAVLFIPPDLPEEQVLVLSLADGTVLQGAGELPADADVHLAMYRAFPQINAIAHIYPENAMCFSGAGRSIPVYSSYHAAHFKREIPCLPAPRQPAEAPLSQLVVEALRKTEVFPFGAALLRYDGALVWDDTPLKAIDCGQRLEGIAAAALQTETAFGASLAPMPEATAAALFEKQQEALSNEPVCGQPGTPVSARQNRRINLALLAYFDKVCRENRIRYSLTGGTLLGAVRHGGMIPWDDDADVFLTRPEYEKLAAAFPDDSRYVLLNREKDPGFNYVFSRLVDTKTMVTYSPNTAGAGKGLCLDICVVDGLPDSALKRKWHMARMRFLVRMRRATIQDPNSKSWRSKGPVVLLAKKILCKLTDLQFWNRRMERIMAKYPFDGGQYVGNFTSQYGARELLHASAFKTYYDVKFENLVCMVCAGYDEYLTSIYKNYMAFPPEKQRKGHHNCSAVWL